MFCVSNERKIKNVNFVLIICFVSTVAGTDCKSARSGKNLKLGRFGRNSKENEQWLDAVQGFLFKEDLDDFKWLIAHEYIEAKLMEKGVNYRSYTDPGKISSYEIGAHWLSPLKNTEGEIIYWDIARSLNPPLPDLLYFNNLNDIVDWYANFYKL